MFAFSAAVLSFLTLLSSITCGVIISSIDNFKFIIKNSSLVTRCKIALRSMQQTPLIRIQHSVRYTRTACNFLENSCIHIKCFHCIVRYSGCIDTLRLADDYRYTSNFKFTYRKSICKANVSSRLMDVLAWSGYKEELYYSFENYCQDPGLWAPFTLRLSQTTCRLS